MTLPKASALTKFGISHLVLYSQPIYYFLFYDLPMVSIYECRVSSLDYNTMPHFPDDDYRRAQAAELLIAGGAMKIEF